MNAVGNEHGSSTSVMPITGPVISSIALIVASRAGRPLPIQRSMFSTTTIESSTTMPTASTSPNRRQVVEREAQPGHHDEGADQRHHDVDDRQQHRPPVLQEHQHDDDHQGRRDEDRVEHVVDRVLDERRGVVGDAVVDALRETSS